MTKDTATKHARQLVKRLNAKLGGRWKIQVIKLTGKAGWNIGATLADITVNKTRVPYVGRVFYQASIDSNKYPSLSKLFGATLPENAVKRMTLGLSMHLTHLRAVLMQNIESMPKLMRIESE